jgi:tyrosine-protein kinase Etk/Wzc
MSRLNNLNFQEENDIKKIFELVKRNFIFFLASLVIALGWAFYKNRHSVPIYQITSSVLIKEDNKQGGGESMNDFLNSNLFGKNLNFQNELWTLQSTPVIEQTVKNLDLSVKYFMQDRFIELDAYKQAPFKVLYSSDHLQPLYVRFNIEFKGNGKFNLSAIGENVPFFKYSANQYITNKESWAFQWKGSVGKLIETKDLSFIIEMDSTKALSEEDYSRYSFQFNDVNSIARSYKNNFQFEVIDKKATVIEISIFSESAQLGMDMVNELMSVYSTQNLNRKNHIATITIDYIEKQLGEISDSLSLTEENLQRFRSSNQLLDVTQQATGITNQYRDLQNQKAELLTRKRYYDYVADYLAKNDEFSNMIVPGSMGINDQILNSLMLELTTAQTQRSNLISNKQEKNPLLKKLDIQIMNVKKTIIDNITAVRQTTNITLDEMDKRIRKIEGQISNMPKTQRQLGGIERKYRLNDAIYNYLLEKRAEAKITKASNLPDDIILEPARNLGPVFPNTKKNYIIAIVLGLGIPFGFFLLKNILNDKLLPQDNIDHLTDVPVVGKIQRNNKKTNNIMFEHPKSSIAESFRALRTNLEFYLKGSNMRKVILVTSCIEGEGKSFNAMNIAMSYAQLGKKVILLDCDLRKVNNYFESDAEQINGISSYLINKCTLDQIILKSVHDNFHYIISGPIPPNPAELLAMDETKELITYLRSKYDYIVIDTPPLAQVTDAYLLFDYSDLKVIVARYNYSKKKILSLIMKDLRQKKIPDVCIVLNDNRVAQDQYGYGYGYNKKGN